MMLLKAVEEQLLNPTAQKGLMGGLESGVSEEVGPAEFPARAQADMLRNIGWESPGGAVQKRATDGDSRRQLIAQIREQVSGSVNKARASSPDLGRTAKPRLEPVGKPQTKPFLRPGEAKRRRTDAGGRVQRRYLEPTEGGVKKSEEKKREGKMQEEKTSEGRVVRLLPPAPAENLAPKGSLGIGLDKLKRWMSL